MKCIVASLSFLLIATSTLSIAGQVQGTVHSLVDNADDIMGKDSDYVLLNGVSEMGSCKTSQGLVVIRIPEADSQAFSMALAAQMSGKTVVVDINDSRKDASGSCVMRWLKILVN